MQAWIEQGASSWLLACVDCCATVHDSVAKLQSARQRQDVKKRGQHQNTSHQCVMVDDELTMDSGTVKGWQGSRGVTMFVIELEFLTEVPSFSLHGTASAANIIFLGRLWRIQNRKHVEQKGSQRL
jgi:hypothetical protein